ncbi:hypothetical protein [Sphingobacterium cavernae]|uniref:hypothetical protein n=1 Tax=Sphingobacterium cavernae TaxID=2592657 RepID=UPI00166F3752|nr:hypothetical protein [Sphingobacterium cavernae]
MAAFFENYRWVHRGVLCDDQLSSLDDAHIRKKELDNNGFYNRLYTMGDIVISCISSKKWLENLGYLSASGSYVLSTIFN